MNSGVARVSILTQHQYEEIHRYIREAWLEPWNKRWPAEHPLRCLQPVSGKRYRGTADAVFQNAELIDSEYVLVLSGDHVYRMDYRDLLRRHVETNADVTIATVEHPLGEACHFGVVSVDERFRVVDFQEKPLSPRPLPLDPARALVSMGVYVFKKAALLGALRNLCGTGLGYDFGRDVIPALIESAHAFAFDFRNEKRNGPAYWRDIGTIDAYYAASMDLLRGEIVFDTAELGVAPGARLNPNCRLTRTVASPGVEVDEGASVCESVLMPNVHVGPGAQLRRVIVEEGVQVPEGYRAGFDRLHDQRRHVVTAAGVVVIAEIPVEEAVAAAPQKDLARADAVERIFIGVTERARVGTESKTVTIHS